MIITAEHGILITIAGVSKMEYFGVFLFEIYKRHH
jgi:hypothetical protein